jgi:hypothetical protein
LTLCHQLLPIRDLLLYMTLGVGIIGLSADGWAGGAHVGALEQLKDKLQLKALLTTREASAQAAAQKYGVKGYHGDPAQIAQDPAVDLVVVSVRTPAHKDSLWPAIEAGKAVFCEWPLGRDLAEARELADFARAKGVRTMIGLQGRQSPAITKAAELVNAGKIGKVLSSYVVSGLLSFRRDLMLSGAAGQRVRLLPWSLASSHGVISGVWGAEMPSRDAYVLHVQNGAWFERMVIAPLSWAPRRHPAVHSILTRARRHFLRSRRLQEPLRLGHRPAIQDAPHRHKRGRQ